jgi:hypothetical protein
MWDRSAFLRSICGPVPGTHQNGQPGPSVSRVTRSCPAVFGYEPIEETAGWRRALLRASRRGVRSFVGGGGRYERPAGSSAVPLDASGRRG